MTTQPFQDEREPRLGLEVVVVDERGIESRDLLLQSEIRVGGPVDGAAYLPMLGVPVTVLTATGGQLTTMREKAVGRTLPVSIFTADLFKTGNDRDNRAAVARVPTAALDLVGLATVGPRNAVDKVTKGGRLHP